MINFGNNMELFLIRGIPIIANKNNRIVIGLDNAGNDLVNMIRRENSEPDKLKDAISAQSQLYQMMEQNGFINQNIVEYKNVDFVYIHLKSKCNLHCKGCYSYIDNRNSQDELSKESWFKLFVN